VPFVTLTPACVLPDAPITAQLFGRIKDDLDHLKDTLSNGAGAPQVIDSSDWDTNGELIVLGDITVGANVYGPATNVQAVAGPLALVFKEKAWINGYEENSSGEQFAPKYGDIVWGEFMALTHALQLLRGGPFLMMHKEAS
jgi:hypothetical protein